MGMMSRRMALLATVAVAGFAVTAALADGLPPLKQKATYKVGFAQTEMNNPWRLAQTKSMKDEAKKLGWQLVYTDAAGSAAKQVADVNSMIAQGVDAIFLSPREEKPLIPAVMAAKKAGIPLFLIDRNVDASLAKPGVDYVTFIGSDFVLEGKQAARMAGQDDRRQGHHPRNRRLDRLFAGQRPQEGLRRRHRQISRHEDRRFADRQLQSRQGAQDRRGAAAGASGSQHHLRPQ